MNSEPSNDLLLRTLIRRNSRPVARARALGPLVAAIVALAGCGGSGGTVTAPKIAPARTFTLAGLEPRWRYLFAALSRDRPLHAAHRLMMPAGIRLRLLAAIVALAAGVAAILIAILLLRSVLA